MLCVHRWENGAVSFDQANRVEFPDKGWLYQLQMATQGEGNTSDGIKPGPSPIWVDQETLTRKLQKAVADPDSNLRKVSDWPIVRTFVYLDISDFSKHPPAHEALIINSLVQIVKNNRLWSGNATSLPERIVAQMCIGDGYIFVFREAMEATYFAAYLAYLIEVLVANRRLPVSFHFRMGVHIGPVYTFWDPGRKDWNFIGEGINGGNRVLSAIDKSYDDMVYISGEVRQQLMATSSQYAAFRQVLEHLHNRGRRADKHGRPWRVYEVSHAAICQNDLPARL
jgi:class 3 adenylate cyclase